MREGIGGGKEPREKHFLGQGAKGIGGTETKEEAESLPEK